MIGRCDTCVETCTCDDDLPSVLARSRVPTVPIEKVARPREAFRFTGKLEHPDDRDRVAELLERLAKQIRETGEIDIILP